MLEHAYKLAPTLPFVRREVALAMRHLLSKPPGTYFLKSPIAMMQDRYYLEAFGIGCTDKEARPIKS